MLGAEKTRSRWPLRRAESFLVDRPELARTEAVDEKDSREVTMTG